LIQRGTEVVGYAYLGPPHGPIALLEATDYPAILAYLENTAAGDGREYIGFEVPLCNRTAVDYLLSRGYQIESFFALFMSSQPPGNLDHYILTSPPFFL